MVKALLVSDLHVDHTNHSPKDYATQFLDSDCEYILLAGDVADGFDTFKKWASEVFTICKSQTFVMVAGNHDFYGCDIARVRVQLLEMGELYPNFIFLDNGSHEVVGAKEPTLILGATLWTDFNHYIEDGSTADIFHWKFRAISYMNDFRYISLGDRKFDPEDWEQEHWASREWLSKAIEMYKDTHKIIVMTHHAPHAKSLDSIYARYMLDHCYTSNLLGKGDVFDNVHMWLHGHVHMKLDYQVANTRVIANPKGYRTISISEDFRTRLEI